METLSLVLLCTCSEGFWSGFNSGIVSGIFVSILIGVFHLLCQRIFFIKINEPEEFNKNDIPVDRFKLVNTGYFDIKQLTMTIQLSCQDYSVENPENTVKFNVPIEGHLSYVSPILTNLNEITKLECLKNNLLREVDYDNYYGTHFYFDISRINTNPHNPLPLEITTFNQFKEIFSNVKITFYISYIGRITNILKKKEITFEY